MLKKTRQIAIREPEESVFALEYGKTGGIVRMGRPRGSRPRIHDEGIIARICAGLVSGKSMAQVCDADPTMPHAREVWWELARDQTSEFFNDIMRARQAQQDASIEDCVEMADNATEDNYNVVKLRIWARQWRAAKLAPKKYGDKISIDNRTQTLNVHVDADQFETIARRIAEEV